MSTGASTTRDRHHVREPKQPAPGRRPPHREDLDIGVRRALREVDERELAGFLLGTLDALTAVACAARKRRDGGAGQEVASWDFPDAVWQRVLRRDPALASFPLGQIAERAVKRTLATLLRDGGLVPGSEPAIQAAQLEASLADACRGDRGRLGRALLAAFLFELALDLLRRSRSGQAQDSPYRYRFDGRPILVPVEEELAWRAVSQPARRSRQRSSGRRLTARCARPSSTSPASASPRPSATTSVSLLPAPTSRPPPRL